MLSNFILYGNLNGLAPGSNIDGCPNAETITRQENDIPGLMQLEIGNLHFEVSVLNKTVLGISYDFEYETHLSFPIGTGEKTIQLGYATNTAALQAWLDNRGIAYNILKKDDSIIEIVIEQSGVRLIVGNGSQLYKAILFDNDLYESLCKTA